MNRLLSILISLFVLFLIYLWINHIMKAPAPSDFPDETSTEVIESRDDEKTSDVTDVPEREGASPEDESPLSAQSQSDPDDTPEETGETQNTDITEKVPQEQEDPTDGKETITTSEPRETVETPQNVAEGSAGPHLVLAGNFLEQSNAEKRASQLREKGFPNAEVVRFQLSQYHTVCAGRFRDVDEARSMARRLKSQHGIDAYVRIGN